jgi:hypothetical protein
MHDLQMPQSMRLALQYSTTSPPPAVDNFKGRLILASPHINKLNFKPKNAQNEIGIANKKETKCFGIDRKGRMQKKNHKSPHLSAKYPRQITHPLAGPAPTV